MLLIILFAAIAAVLIGISVAIQYINDWSFYEIWRDFGIVFIIICLVMCFFAAQCNYYKDLTIEKKLIERESLVYQLKSNYYNRLTYDGRADLMKQILNFNKELMSSRVKHDSIWVSVFYPEDWERVPFIELN